MAIDLQQVRGIAELARLDLSDDKLATFAEQLGDVLSYMEALDEVDVADVEPMFSPVEHATVLRPDQAAKEFPRAEILANAPETDGSFFIVPKIV